MCLIFIRENRTVDVDRATLKRALERNADGAGIVWRNGDKWTARRTVKLTESRLMAWIDEMEAQPGLWAIHFRLTTGGGVKTANCHPFPVGNGAFLMHNGTLKIDPTKEASDTRIFAHWARRVSIVENWNLHAPIIEGLRNNSRLAWFAPDGAVIKQGAWTTKDDGAYSNTFSHAPERTTFTTWDDVRGSYTGSYYGGTYTQARPQAQQARPQARQVSPDLQGWRMLNDWEPISADDELAMETAAGKRFWVRPLPAEEGQTPTQLGRRARRLFPAPLRIAQQAPQQAEERPALPEGATIDPDTEIRVYEGQIASGFERHWNTVKQAWEFAGLCTRCRVPAGIFKREAFEIVQPGEHIGRTDEMKTQRGWRQVSPKLIGRQWRKGYPVCRRELWD